METKIRKVGNSSAILLPKEVMAKLSVQQGDKINLIETSEGIMITSYDAQVSKQMDLAAKVMRDNRNMLKKLAE